MDSADSAGRAPGFRVRLAWHLRLAARASRSGAAAAAVGGLLMRLVLPVSGAWLAAAVALGATAGGLLCLAVAPSLPRLPPAPRPVPRGGAPGAPDAAVEGLATAEQLAHAFLRAGLVLGAFAAGLLAAGAAGLGSS